jgi:hypothetical protein
LARELGHEPVLPGLWGWVLKMDNLRQATCVVLGALLGAEITLMATGHRHDVAPLGIAILVVYVAYREAARFLRK